MSTPTPEQIEAVFADAVQTAAAALYPGDLVTRWVVLVESLDTNGERGLVTATQSGAKLWDTLGLLGFAAGRELGLIPDEGDQ